MIPSRYASTAALALVLCGCSSQPAIQHASADPERATSASVRQRIASFESDPQHRDARSITKVMYQGEAAYLFISPCCDHFNYLYDADGRKLCAPSGGFAGYGDGTCKAPFEPRLRTAGSSRRDGIGNE